MKNNKAIIDKYIQPVYIPNNLYICKNCSNEYLKKFFSFTDRDLEYIEDYTALTYYGVKCLKDNKQCMVVVLCDQFMNAIKSKDRQEIVDVCAHEGFHVAHRILENCNVILSGDSCEAFAYMTGWAARCIYTTAIKK